MEKTALSPKAKVALKLLAGLGAAGGVGVGGGVVGYRKGAGDVADAMAQEFTIQNATENQAIADSFKAFNINENRQIANNAFQKGIQYAAASGLMKESGMDDIVKAAFIDELEKISAAGSKQIMKALKSVIAGYKKSGKAVTELPGAFSKYMKASKGKIPIISSIQKKRKSKDLIKKLKESGLALGTAGSLAGGVMAS